MYRPIPIQIELSLCNQLILHFFKKYLHINLFHSILVAFYLFILFQAIVYYPKGKLMKIFMPVVFNHM